MDSQSIHFGKVRNYLDKIADDSGGSQAAKEGRAAATRYLSRGEKSGVVPARLLGVMFALSMTALALTGQFDRDPSSDTTARTTPTQGVGCTFTVSEENGKDGAWGIAEDIAPVGDLEEIFDYLREQQRGTLHARDTLLVPPEACDNDLVEPISELQQKPAE